MIGLGDTLLLMINDNSFKTYEKRKNNQQGEQPFFSNDGFSRI
jgi:hypothetical protein